ncbi:MAG: hypothetical protein MHPSP_003630, partial [Paramarteilia canceri]
MIQNKSDESESSSFNEIPINIKNKPKNKSREKKKSHASKTLMTIWNSLKDNVESKITSFKQELDLDEDERNYMTEKEVEGFLKDAIINQDVTAVIYNAKLMSQIWHEKYLKWTESTEAQILEFIEEKVTKISKSALISNFMDDDISLEEDEINE